MRAVTSLNCGAGKHKYLGGWQPSIDHTPSRTHLHRELSIYLATSSHFRGYKGSLFLVGHSRSQYGAGRKDITSRFAQPPPPHPRCTGIHERREISSRQLHHLNFHHRHHRCFACRCHSRHSIHSIPRNYTETIRLCGRFAFSEATRFTLGRRQPVYHSSYNGFSTSNRAPGLPGRRSSYGHCHLCPWSGRHRQRMGLGCRALEEATEAR